MTPKTSENTLLPHISEWPPEGLESVPNCPACGSKDRSKLHDRLTDQIFYCAPGHWTLYQCAGCRSAYLDPRPTTETIHLAYHAYYTHSQSRPTAPKELHWLRRFMRAAANGYRNQRYGGNLRPAFQLGALIIRLLPSYKRTLDHELYHLPRVWPEASLLDVGFGSGAFLERAQSAGWNAKGIDPDPTTVKNAQERGLNVDQGTLETLTKEYQRFDAITLSHVIEHVHEPRETLDAAFRLLKPGGRLYIETPNIEAVGHMEYGRHWRGLEPPRHLTIFSWNALENMLTRIGFTKINKHLRPGVYRNLSAKSRALKEGKDPYKAAKVTIRDRSKNALIALKSKKDHRNTEFITLTAHKDI